MVRYLYFVPFAPAEGTEHSANASLIVRKVPEDTDTTWANQLVYSRGYPNYIVVNECKDNEFWKSYLWQAQDNKTKYIGLERIGVTSGILIQAMLSFPLIDSIDNYVDEGFKVLMFDTSQLNEEQMKSGLLIYDYCLSIINDFNFLCESSDIDSTADFRTRFMLYDIPTDGVQFYRNVSDSSEDK